MAHSPAPSRHSAAFYRRFVQEREAVWREMEELVKDSGGKASGLSAAKLLRLAELYPEAAADLALVQRELPSQRLVEHIAYLVGESYRLLYRPEEEGRGGFKTWLASALPRAVRAILPDLLWLAFLFLLAALTGYALTLERPGFGRTFVSPEMEAGLKRGELWTESIFSTVPASLLSSAIITNNISVTFAAFAGGILFGIGSLYIVLLNGVMLGAVVATCQHYGMASPLLEFVCGHGFIEISAILLAAAAGLGLARGILEPGRRPRSQALQEAAKHAAALLILTCGVLLVAGIVEGFLSPSPAVPPPIKLFVGLMLQTALVLGLFLLHRSGPAPASSQTQSIHGFSA